MKCLSLAVTKINYFIRVWTSSTWRPSFIKVHRALRSTRAKSWGPTLPTTILITARHSYYKMLFTGHRTLSYLDTYRLVDSAQCLGAKVPDWLPVWVKTWFSQLTRRFRIPKLYKGGPPIELPSLQGMQVQAESPLMVHPGNRSVKDSVKLFLHTPGKKTHMGWLLTTTEPIKKEMMYEDQKHLAH